MATQEVQVIDSIELPAIDDYQFSGDSLTVGRKRQFIVNYREEGSVYHAARLTRISRQCVYNWIQADQEFAQAVEESKEDCYDQAESSVFKKALAGDSLLLMFYLKAHRHKFRDKVSIDIEGVRSEIEERMAQLQLKQLPAMTGELLGVESLNLPLEPAAHVHVWSNGQCLRCGVADSLNGTDSLQFPPQPEQIEKENDSSPLE